MKIPLNVGQSDGRSQKSTINLVLERDIKMTKKGDWNSRHNLEKTFYPLLRSLAEKRSSDNIKVNEYIEAGKLGLLKAAKKYKIEDGADKFQLFALDFIEKYMDRLDSGGGFFARLFGK